MVQRITPIGTYRLTMRNTAIEHQNSGGRRVYLKNPKHEPLIIVLEMKEAIPSQYSVKSPAKAQRPHIGNDPLLIWHPVSA
jgi:hypothetical protein